MEKVYVLLRSEYRDDTKDRSIIRIHKTPEGAKEDFLKVVADEKAEYMYAQTGSTDATKEDMELAGVDERYQEDEDGTIYWHIWQPDGWDEVFIQLFSYTLFE